jgi:hypothetical protein
VVPTAVREVDPGLPPLSAWVLGRVGRADGEPAGLPEDPEARARGAEALADLRARGLVEAEGTPRPTATGEALRAELAAAHGRRLRELAADWDDDGDPDVERLLRSLAEELAQERPAGVA